MEKVIRTAPREVLLTIGYFEGLAMKVVAEGIDRRDRPDAMSDVLEAFTAAGGILLTGEGEDIDVYPGMLHDVHGDDASVTWPSKMVKCLETPRQRRPRETLLQRLQVYDAYYRVLGTPVEPVA